MSKSDGNILAAAIASNFQEQLTEMLERAEEAGSKQAIVRAAKLLVKYDQHSAATLLMLNLDTLVNNTKYLHPYWPPSVPQYLNNDQIEQIIKDPKELP